MVELTSILGNIPIIGSLFVTPQDPNKNAALQSIPEFDPVAATEGVAMWRFAGRRVRVPGTVIYVSDIDKEVDTEKAGGKDSESISAVRYTIDIAIAFGQAFFGDNGAGKIASIRSVSANSKNVYLANDPGKNDDRYSDIRLYEGGASQGPDPILESIKGAGKVPGFRDTVVVVIEGFELEDFGNAVPQQWEAVLAPDPHSGGSPYRVGELIQNIWSRIPDRQSWEIDVSEVTGANLVRNGDSPDVVVDGQVEGFLVEGPRSPADLLQIVVAAYDVGVQNYNGKLRFYDRGSELIHEVLAEHLGANDGKSGSDRPIKLRRLPHVKLPTECVVNYYSPRTGFRRDSDRQRVNTPTFDGENVATFDLPFVLPRKAVRRFARRRLYEGHRQRIYCDLLPLPPCYQQIREGHYVAVPYTDEEGEARRLYIHCVQVTVGHDFRVEIEGPVVEMRGIDDPVLTSIPISSLGGDLESDDDSADDEDEDEDPAPEDSTVEDYAPNAMEAELLDMPPVTESEAASTGMYYAHAMRDPAGVFKGAKVIQAKASGGTYKPAFINSLSKEMVLGYVQSKVAIHVSYYGKGTIINTTQGIRVTLTHGSMSTITRDELYERDCPNELQIGTERLRARVITAVTPTTSSSVTLTVTGATRTVTLSSGTWSGLGVTRGEYVRFDGLTEEANQDPRQVLDIAGAGSQIILSGPDEMADEGPSTVDVVANENTYDLSEMIRGLAGTDYDGPLSVITGLSAITNRIPVVQALGGGLEFLPLKQGQIGSAIYYKALPKGLVELEAPERTKVFGSVVSRPMRIAHFHFLRDTDGDPDDLEVRWVHATRLPGTDPTDTALHQMLPNEAPEKYRIQLATGFDGTTFEPTGLLRDRKLTYAEHVDDLVRAFTYNQAAQVNDGLTPGAQVYVRVRQMAIGNKADGPWGPGTIATGGWQLVQARSVFQPETSGLAAMTAEYPTKIQS